MADQPVSQPGKNLHDIGEGLSVAELLADAATDYARHQARKQQSKPVDPKDESQD